MIRSEIPHVDETMSQKLLDDATVLLSKEEMAIFETYLLEFFGGGYTSAILKSQDFEIKRYYHFEPSASLLEVYRKSDHVLVGGITVVHELMLGMQMVKFKPKSPDSKEQLRMGRMYAARAYKKFRRVAKDDAVAARWDSRLQETVRLLREVIRNKPELAVEEMQMK